MTCRHTNIILNPGTIIPDGDGFLVGDIDKGTMICRSCNDQLPIEDLQFYPKDRISIAIPADMVDNPIVSEPLE